jgi:hypothetical protein
MIALLLSLVMGSNIVRQEACDMVELHHMHDANGSHVFDQIIFWDWDEQESEYHVRAWFISYGKEHLHKNYRSNLWTIIWPDNRTWRGFVAKHFRESWLQRDPERDDKASHPEHKRIALRK